MRSLCIAGVATLASLGAQAQVAPPRQSAEPVVVTATRALSAVPTLRNAIVITREELEAAGALSLAEVLQRRAGIDLRATGGPGQPQSLFIQGATAAQTLVLVDGLRVGSATAGTTAIEHIPLEMIERVEVVKGTMSSLYGAEAIGGVVQIFTRGKTLPHLFVATGYGSANDRRVSAGLTTEDQGTLVSLATGARRVNAPSATNPRAGFLYNPDRDPYENAFFNLRASQRLWQGETVELEAFGTRSRTHFDAGAGDDRSDQSISGAKLTSSTHFMPWWASRLALGEGRDRLVIRGGSPDVLETRQQQVSWINEFATPRGTFLAGVETVRQRVVSDEERTRFTRTHRDTSSAFAAVNESFAGQRVEASVRRDDDDEFGKRNTGSTSYGWEWPSVGRLAATYATGFRAPTFFDLYGPAFEGYTPNPALEPERSKSYELAFRADPAAALQWRVSAFDHRFENLIVYSFIDSTVLNVARARTRGIEASIEATWLGARWRASLTAQRPRDESSGKRLQGRAERYGTLEATRTFGSWTAGVSVLASGPRFDSADEAPASRLGGYAVVDASLRYAIDKRWTAELTATNLGDRRRESAVGYDAPRRGLFLSLRFESF